MAGKVAASWARAFRPNRPFEPRPSKPPFSLVYRAVRFHAESLIERRTRARNVMTFFRPRRAVGTVAAVLAGLLSGAAAANAGACDAKRAQSLVGRSYSPRLEQETLALSGASTAAIFGQGLAGTADYRTDRVDLWLDRKGNVVGISCG
jgi:hypothetical protein